MRPAAASYGPGACGAASRRSASSGAGSTSTPGLSRLSGSRRRLACCISAIACGGVHPRQQLRAGPAVAVLARHRAAVRRHQVGRVLDELPVAAAPAGVLELEVDAHVHAAVAEVAVRDAVQRALAAAARRSRAGSRRACSGGTAASSQPACAGRLSERAASPAPSSRIRHSASCSATSVTTRCGTPAAAADRLRRATRASAASAPVTSANSQPPPAGQLRVAAATIAAMRWSRPSHATESGARAGRARRRRRRPSSGSRAPPAPGPGRPRPAGPSRRAPRRGCPRCRPGTGRTGGPSPGSRCSKE